MAKKQDFTTQREINKQHHERYLQRVLTHNKAIEELKDGTEILRQHQINENNALWMEQNKERISTIIKTVRKDTAHEYEHKFQIQKLEYVSELISKGISLEILNKVFKLTEDEKITLSINN